MPKSPAKKNEASIAKTGRLPPHTLKDIHYEKK